MRSLLVLLVGVASFSVGTEAWARGRGSEDREKQKMHREAETHIQKGLELMGAGSFEEAIKEFQDADAIEPVASTTEHIGECYEALGKLDLAVGAYQQYLQETGASAPDAELIKKHIGELEGANHVDAAKRLRDEKKLPEALKELQAAYDAKPDPKLLYEMANIEEELGENAKAADAYERYLKALPDAPDFGEVQGRIKVLRGEKIAAPPPPPAPPRMVSRPFYTSKPGDAVAVGGVLLAIGGGVCLGLAANSRAIADRSTFEPDFTANQNNAITLSGVGVGLVGAGVVALAASVVLYYLHTRPYEERSPAPEANKPFVPQGSLDAPSLPLVLGGATP